MGRLLIFTGMSLIGLCGAPAMVSGNTADGAPSADAWGILLAEARAEERQCGGDTYAAGPQLTWNDRLGAAAQAHSEDMVHMNQLSHEGSEGETLADRLGGAGYKARAWAENVAAGQPDATTVVAAWLDSRATAPTSCLRIIRSSARLSIGTQAAHVTGRWYWLPLLQNFWEG